MKIEVILIGKSIILDVEGSDLIGKVKKMITEKERIPKGNFYLQRGGKKLKGSNTLAHYNIKEDYSRINLVVRCRGGFSDKSSAVEPVADKPHVLVTLLSTPIGRSHVPVKNVLIVRLTKSSTPGAPQSNAQDDSSLILLEDDVIIPEEEAVCKDCYGTFRDEQLLRVNCGCQFISLIHEKCALEISKRGYGSKCVGCEKEVQSVPVVLLAMPTAAETARKRRRRRRSLLERLSCWCALF